MRLWLPATTRPERNETRRATESIVARASIPEAVLLRYPPETTKAPPKGVEMKATAIKAAVAVAVMCVPSLAHAQGMPSACGDYVAAMSGLEANYGETTVMRGVGSDGRMVEITKSEDGGFSIMLTDPQRGMTCMVYAGEAMDFTVAPLPGRPL